MEWKENTLESALNVYYEHLEIFSSPQNHLVSVGASTKVFFKPALFESSQF